MNKLDRELPHNNLPLLPPDTNLDDIDILKSTISTGKAVAELKARLTFNKRSVANTLDLLSPLFIPEAVASSGVENIITTNSKVYEAQIKEARELTPVEKETLRYTEAVKRGAELLHQKGFLATNDFIELQGILEPDKKGIRNIPGTQLKNPISGKIYYTPPEGQKRIRDFLQNYELYYNEEVSDVYLYARMAILHYQLEAIHPFFDGNGRTGRILMPLYLTLKKELPVPVLFISKYILDNRDEYYEKLRNVTEKNDWKAWILYILRATETQAKYTTGILNEIQTHISKDKKLISEKYKSMYSAELLDFLFSHAYFTVANFEKELKISKPTAYKYLDILEQEGIVRKKQQEGRNRLLYTNLHYTSILLNA